MAGNYEKLHVLGTGSFGQAWLVEDKENVKCVLKEIKLTSMSEKEIDQTLVEVTVLAKCRHVNVVKYHEAFVDDGCLKIVMEYADGGDLQKRIHAQRGIHFSKEVVLDWLVQIAFALMYIHNRNILHRDLKPQNVFLTSQNIVKLGDFGISRILKHSEDYALTTIGTPYYLSPEICQKKPYDYKSDMWALGCILYELCCLRVPFDAPDITSLVLKIVEGKYAPLPSHFGPLIEDLVAVLLDPNPDKRPTAEQVLLIPKLQPHVKDILKGHVERKRINSDSSPKSGGPSSRKASKEISSPIEIRKAESLSRGPKILSPIMKPRRPSVVKVKVTGRRLSVPNLICEKFTSNSPPVRILNGKVVSPENKCSPASDNESPELKKPLCPAQHFLKDEPQIKKLIANKENIVLPKTYRVGNPRILMRRHSLFTPYVNSLVKKQKEKEIQSCQVPKRVEKKKLGPAPTKNLFRDFLESRSESTSPAANVSENYGTDDDVFDGKTPPSKGRESINSLTYRISELNMDQSPEVATESDTSSMKQNQLLYESVISNYGNSRKAVVTLTTYLQKQLGAKQFQQLYSLILDSAKSATEFRIVREKAGGMITYMPLIIQLLQLERALD